MGTAHRGKPVYKIFFVFLTMFFLPGFLLETRADWTMTLNVSLNANGQLPMEFGKKAGATDNFDAGIDQLAAPQTPDGDTYYFRSITGEATPKDKLLSDFRANDNTQAAWRLALTAADTKTFVVSWNAGTLPAGWGITWQEADSSWVGNGTVHHFTESPTQITLANTTGDLFTQRYLIVASPREGQTHLFLPLILK
jgi:hypothetical protein